MLTEKELSTLTEQIGGRPCWLASSTHEGEDAIIIAAHKILRADFPDILTIIAPRHPKRAPQIAALASQCGTVTERSKKEVISSHTSFYIADTLGELGLFYNLADIAFIGGSLTQKGGHNPLEPARIGATILHGPHIFNFHEAYESLRQAGGAALVRNERELASAVRRLLRDEKTRRAMASAALKTACANGKTVLSRICARLSDIMNTAQNPPDA